MKVKKRVTFRSDSTPNLLLSQKLQPPLSPEPSTQPKEFNLTKKLYSPKQPAPRGPIKPNEIPPEVRDQMHVDELERDRVKELDLWEQQNTNHELNFYASALSLKIKSQVGKKSHNSPRLNQENLNQIMRSPPNANNYGFKRERVNMLEFKGHPEAISEFTPSHVFDKEGNYVRLKDEKVDDKGNDKVLDLFTEEEALQIQKEKITKILKQNRKLAE